MRLHEITQLLTESRLDYLIKNYSTQVGTQLSKDHTFLVHSSSEEYPKLATNWITDLINKDPSNKGIYTQWMVIQYLKGNFLYEDSGNLLDDLTYFHVNKRAFEQKDINQYTVDQLYDTKKQIEDQAEPIQSKRQEKAQLKQGAEKVLETENVLVIWPQTKKAAQYYGSGTRWCTSSRNHNMFSYYNKKGPLYIIIDKKTNEKFQIHFEKREIRDAEDKSVKSINNFTIRYPEVLEHFKKEFTIAYPYETMPIKERLIHVKENTKIILDTDNSLVIQPLTPLTYYDTLKPRDRNFNYNSIIFNEITHDHDNLYIVIDKKLDTRYEIHSKTSKNESIFKVYDSNHDGVAVKAFIKRYPEIFNHFEEEFKEAYPRETKSLEEKRKRVKNNSKVILETDRIVILATKSKKVMSYFINFSGDFYASSKDIKYIIIDKKRNEYYGILESFSLIDTENMLVTTKKGVYEFLKKYPEVYNHFKEEFNMWYPHGTLSKKEREEHIEKNTKILLNTKKVMVSNLLTPLAYHNMMLNHNRNFHNNQDRFKRLIQNGPIYSIYDKSNREILLIEFNKKYYRSTANDNHWLNINKIIKKYPEVVEHFKEEFKNAWPNKFMSLEEKRKLVNNKDIKIILDNDKILLLNTKSMTAANYFISTDWWETDSMYICIDKNTNESYAIEYDWDLADDRYVIDIRDGNTDREIESSKFSKKYPLIYKKLKEILNLKNKNI